MAMAAVECAVRYAALGWKIVLLHEVIEVGLCSCSKGKDCPSPGKHPRHTKWQDTASSDEETIYSWGEKYPNANFGLLLGPQSRVIDIEYDTDEGRETIARMGLDQLVTPTYKSARSIHRLFQWTSELPDVQKVEVRGLEIRIGGGNKATQSALPPSRHPTGTHYEWLSALSALEVDLLPVPESIIAACHNRDPSAIGDRPASKSRNIITHQSVTEGKRTDSLYSYACRYVLGRDMNDPRQQADLYEVIAALNEKKCRPILPESKIKTIHSEAIQFAFEKTSDPVQNAAAFVKHGLQFFGDGQGWSRGDWIGEIVESDPLMYRLTVPAWKGKPGEGVFMADVETWRSPAKMAALIQSVTGDVCLVLQRKVDIV